MIKNTSEDDDLTKLVTVWSGIENQEARGQRELVRSSQLPAKWGGYNQFDASRLYAQMGIEVIGITEDDPLFFKVILPDGWKKQATDHSMWSHLMDEKGRKRAMIFYKAAFYDRDAFIDPEQRFSFRVIEYLPEEEKGHYKEVIVKIPISGNENIRFSFGDQFYIERGRQYEIRKTKEWVAKYKDHYDETNHTPMYFEVYDGDVVIYSTKQTPVYFKRKYKKDEHSQWWAELEKVKKELATTAIAYLDEKYPGWNDPFTYWN